jgi:hypothetical protein
VFDVAVAGTLLAACGLAKPQAAIEPNSRYTDIKNAVAKPQAAPRAKYHRDTDAQFALKQEDQRERTVSIV